MPARAEKQDLDIHKRHLKYDRATEALAASDISDGNRQRILAFIRHKRVAENIGIARQTKYLHYLRIMAELLRKNFDEASAEDIDLINLSTAETEDKVLWKNKTREVENLVEEGKCQKALNELNELEGEIKNYKPKQVEKTEEPVESGEKGGLPDITLVVAIALIILLIVIVLIVRGKSKGK